MKSTPRKLRRSRPAAPCSAPVEVHIRGFSRMPKRTQNALVEMFTIIAEKLKKDPNWKP